MGREVIFKLISKKKKSKKLLKTKNNAAYVTFF